MITPPRRHGGRLSPVPSRRAHQGGNCGAAQIQRIAQNAPCWPDEKIGHGAPTLRSTNSAAGEVLSVTTPAAGRNPNSSKRIAPNKKSVDGLF